MPLRNIDIDELVRQVLSQLGDGSITNGSKADLTIDERVVSVAQLGRNLDDTQKLVVRADAIFTPAARDLIAERKVDVVRASASSLQSPAETALLFGAVAKGGSASSALAALRTELASCDEVTANEISELVENMAEAMKDAAKLGMILTDEVAAAVCLANRNRGVRAAAIAGFGDVRDTVSAIGANLLVVDSRGRTTYEVVRIAREFRAVGPQSCPEKFRQNLA